MSDKIYSEIPVVGDKYNKGDWKIYAVHDENNIKGLYGPYRFLSNTYKCPVCYEGLTYHDSESAYHAAKVIPALRPPYQNMSFEAAKSAWRSVPVENQTPNWNAIKYQVMEEILRLKFSQNPELGQKLIDTAHRHIEETNHWGDTFWGVDFRTGKGENNLGKILMHLRALLSS